MGLFQHKQEHGKKSSNGDVIAAEEHFFDEYFREELRNHGRWYFEKVINENGELFKRDLEETIKQVNIDLKEHVTQQLDGAIAKVQEELKDHVAAKLQEQFDQNSASLKAAQDEALKKITETTDQFQAEHKTLKESLEKNVADQQTILHNAFEENKAQITTMKEAQDNAMKWLNQSAQSLNDQYQSLAATLQKNAADQQNMLVDAFQSNMAAIVEQYLLGALGDQYDLKAQLPAIIKQMEENKQAIVDDMKL